MKCKYCDCDEEFCYCNHCTECGSNDLTAYDDGEGYPPNIKCNNCGNWD